MADLYQITPFLHVPDLNRALAFLTGVLRFQVKYQEPSYAYLEWEAAAEGAVVDQGPSMPF